MTFLQQTMLWGLFAVSIPVIIHLLNRRRFRTVEWGAMQFLLKATRESRGKKRLKHILILLMRSLAIAALVFAIARPLVGGLLGWGAGRVDTVILILDRSASMERPDVDSQITKRESVLERVADAVRELGDAELVLIDSATGLAQVVPSPEVLPDLSFTAPTDTAADIPGLLTTALDYLGETKPPRSEIWVASDLQHDDWAPQDNRWDAFRASLDAFDFDVKLRVLGLSGRERNDHSIRVLAARREAGDLVLDLEINREEDRSSDTMNLTISHLGSRSAHEETISESEQTHRFAKRIPLEGHRGGGHGWVSINDSANQQNNVAYYAYGAEAPLHAYLVVEGTTDDDTLEALTRGLAPGYANQEVEVLAPERAHAINYDIASLVVWKAPLPTPPISDQLLEFVKSGGVCLFFPPQTESEASFGGLAWEAVNESPENKTFIVEEWEHADGGFRDGDDGTPLPVQNLKAFKRRGISGDYTALANWSDDEPLLARRIIDQGKIVFFTTLPDYTWSNLELTALHLVLLQRSFDDGSLRLGAGFFGVAGRESAQPQDDEVRSRLDTYPRKESGSREPAFEAGVYRFGERVVAVNRPVEEDSIKKLGNDELDAALIDTNYSLLEEETASKDPFFREAWRAFLFAMLLFLIVEALLCLQPRRVEAGTAPAPTPTT